MNPNILNVRPLSKQLAAIAKEEYGEDESTAYEKVQEIRKWVDETPHLKECVQKDDQFLLNFVRGCRFDMDLLKLKMDRYYSVRNFLKIVYSNLDPFSDDVQEVLKLGIVLPLLKPLEDGTRVILYRWGVHDPTKIDADMIARLGYLIATVLLLEDDNSAVVGHSHIYDIQGGTMKLYFQLSMANIKKLIYFGEKIQPVYQNQIHFVHIPRYGETLFSVAKLFLSPETNKKIFVNSKLKKLQEKISADIFPKEYGGTEGTVQELIDYWKNKVESHRTFFLEQETKHSDESKRIGELDPIIKAFKDM